MKESIMTKSVYHWLCLFLTILSLFAACESSSSETTSPTPDIGMEERLGDMREVSVEPEGGQCGLEGNEVSICTQGGSECTATATPIGASDSQACLTDTIRSASSEEFTCSSSEDCNVIEFGFCGEAVVVSAERFSELEEISCRFQQCNQYIYNSLDGGKPYCENETIYLNPIAQCVSGICQITEGPSEPTCPPESPACQDAGM